MIHRKLSTIAGALVLVLSLATMMSVARLTPGDLAAAQSGDRVSTAPELGGGLDPYG